VNSLVYFALNVACFLPILVSLDLVTPPAFAALAGLVLVVRRPDRWWALLAAWAGALVLAWWVYLSNLLWTVGPDPGARALVLALRAWALTATSAAFALGIRSSELLNEAMQLARLPARVGFALFTALNVLPRMVAEQKHLDAVHRVRLGGRRSSLLVQGVTLLAGAIRTGERSAQSMAARGLEAPGPRTWFRPVAWTPADLVWLVGGILVAVGLFGALVATGLFRFGFY